MEQNERPETEGNGSRRNVGRWILGGTLAVAAIAGVTAASATGGGLMRMEPGHQMMAPAMVHMGGGFAHRRLGDMLEELDVTAEQEARLWEIFGAAQAEIGPMARTFRQTREELAELLSAPAIDRNALETLRTERLATLDELSKKMLETLVEAAEVLTPEQRAKLVTHMKERRSHRRW
jgi:Spy/CpxP family protein refolding chaperone